MSCKRCKTEPVIKLHSGVSLCKKCFTKYFERKVYKTISKYRLIEKKDKKIGVAVSGGADSLTTLKIMNDIANKRRAIQIKAIAIDEGIGGYRNATIKNAKNFCEENEIELEIIKFKEEFGMSLDRMIKKLKKERPCTICGVLRRHLLNKYSKVYKFDKLATGHNLDDEAESILMNQFRRNVETSARLGPITGIVKDPRFVRRIKPLYFMMKNEVKVYAKIKKIKADSAKCPYAINSFRYEVRKVLNTLEEKYPGTKYSVIASFLEILPLLKEKYKIETKIKSCKICGEPCAMEVCKACLILRDLGVKKF